MMKKSRKMMENGDEEKVVFHLFHLMCNSVFDAVFTKLIALITTIESILSLSLSLSLLVSHSLILCLRVLSFSVFPARCLRRHQNWNHFQEMNVLS